MPVENKMVKQLYLLAILIHRLSQVCIIELNTKILVWYGIVAHVPYIMTINFTGNKGKASQKNHPSVKN